MHAMSARIVDLHDDEPFMVPNEHRHVEFRLHSPAEEVYLLLGGADGSAKAFHRMEQFRKDDWRLILGLQPGTYRYRYYAFDGTLTTFMLPNDGTHETASRIHHFDAEIVVPPRGPSAQGSELLRVDQNQSKEETYVSRHTSDQPEAYAP